MSIVTRTGDDGTTGLIGGKRVSKAENRIHAYGTVDELNAVLGIVLANRGLSAPLRVQIEELQHLMFRLGAELALPQDAKNAVPGIGETQLNMLDKWILELETRLPKQTSFVIPGGSEAAAALHLARTVCRRAERWTASLGQAEAFALRFLNRLGDYLFLAARAANHESGANETPVRY